MSTSIAYQYATAPGGIGLDAMNKNIQDFFAANPTESATQEAMKTWGVSEEDIKRATGLTLNDYYGEPTWQPGTYAYGVLVPEFSPDSPAGQFQSALASGTPVEDARLQMNANILASEYERAGYDPAYVAQVEQDYLQQLYGARDIAAESQAASQVPASQSVTPPLQTLQSTTPTRQASADPAATGALQALVTSPATSALSRGKLSRDDVEQNLLESTTLKPAYGSQAYQFATAPGGIGIDRMNQNIRDFLATNPSEVKLYEAMQTWGVSKEDIERATGKAYTDIFPERFTPGSVITSGFGDVTTTLGGDKYYKGILVPTFTEKSLGDAGWLSAGAQAEEWRKNIDLLAPVPESQQVAGVEYYRGVPVPSFDDTYGTAEASGNILESALNKRANWERSIDNVLGQGQAPFGYSTTLVYSQPVGDYDPVVVGTSLRPTTAIDYLLANNATIADAVVPHTTTFTSNYKVVNGELKEVNPSDITPEDIASGNAFFMIGGKTGGPERERMAQLYRAQGDELIPVGDPKMYRGEVKKDFGLQMLDMAASMLSWVPGPWQIPAQIYTATRGAMAGDISGIIKAVAPPIVSTAYDVYKAVDSGNYVGALMSVVGQTDIGKQLGGVDLGGGFKVADAITAVNVVDRINAGDYAGALKGVGSLTGSAEASTAGTALQLAKALESGNPQAIMAAGQGLINNVNNLTAKSQVANLLINSQGIGAIDADRGSGDLFATTGTTKGDLFATTGTTKGGLSTLAGDPQLDLANQQRSADANQAISDYIMSDAPDRVGLTNQLKALGITDPEPYITQADRQLANIAEQKSVNTAVAGILNQYSKIDPQSGYMGLDRETAREQLIAAGLLGDQAEAELQRVDDQVATKIENAGLVRDAYSAFVKSTPAQREAAETSLRESMSTAGYTPAQINNQVLLGRGVIEGQQKLTTGEQAQERAASLPDIRADIAGKSTFGEAYATAREKLGAGATFTWQGRDYVASSAEERPDLASAKKAASTNVSDAPFVASNGMHNRSSFIQQGGGTSDADYAKYVNAVNAVISQGLNGNLIKPSSVNSAGKDLPSTKGPVTMETPKVDTLTGSILATSAANFGANTLAGPLSAMGFTELGAQVLAKANALASVATAAQGPEIAADKKAIDSAISQVGKSKNLRDAAVNVGNLVSTLFQHPKGFGVSVLEELGEEVLQVGVLKGIKAGLSAKELVTSATENGGAAYNETFANEKKAGASDSEAHKNAQIAAGSAAGATVVFLGGGMAASNLAGRVIGSKADDVATGVVGRTQDLGKTAIKESIQEFGEEGAVAGTVDLALTGAIDPVRLLTNATGGFVFGGPTSGVMQATGVDAVDTKSTSIGAGITPGPAAGGATDYATTGKSLFDSATVGSNVGTQIQDAAMMGGDLTVATNDVITSTLTPALDAGQSITTLGPAVIHQQ